MGHTEQTLFLILRTPKLSRLRRAFQIRQQQTTKTKQSTPSHQAKAKSSTLRGRTPSPTLSSPTTNQATMGLMWTKGFGGKHAGGGVVIDKHGARRAPFRFSFKGLNCFK